MPALLDDAGEADAGHGRVAELVLDDGERLAVLRPGRRRKLGLRQERVNRRGEIDSGRRGEAEGGPAMGGRHEGCSTARPPWSPSHRRGGLRRKRVVFAHEQRGAQALAVPHRLAIGAGEFAGNGPFPSRCGSSPRFATSEAGQQATLIAVRQPAKLAVARRAAPATAVPATAPGAGVKPLRVSTPRSPHRGGR